MEKINVMLFLCIILSFSSFPLNHLRKLQTNSNETVLLGYENYNITSKDGQMLIYFETYFYLKNWEESKIEIMSENPDYFTIHSIIYNQNMNTSVDFNCSNNYQWFKNNYYDSIDRNCSKDGYCIAKYICEANTTDLSINIPKKIDLTTNFSEEVTLNGTPVTYISSSAKALEKDLVSLKYKTENFKVLDDVVLVSQSPTSFKIRGKKDDYKYKESENLQLITNVKGLQKKILCSGKKALDPTDDTYRFFIESKGTNSLGGVDLNYALLNYTKQNKGKNSLLLLDFAEGGKNATILEPKSQQKRKSKGLSTGGIVAIVIPSCLVLLGAVGLVFFLSRRAVPPPPVNNFANKTLGVASSEAIVHQ